MGVKKRQKQEAALASVERDAGDAIGARIAEGRPSPNVWRAAAARHAARGSSADAWYRASRTSVDDAGPALPDAGTDLVLRVVRLPLGD